jgi:ATP synthase protein I
MYRCRLVETARRRYLLNSPASGRRLALRITLLQLAAAVVLGLAFLPAGRRAAMAAAIMAIAVALGTGLMSYRFFSGVGGAGLAWSRFVTGLILKWIVIVGGLGEVMFHYKLPPLAAIAGLVAAYAVYLLAFRFKG